MGLDAKPVSIRQRNRYPEQAENTGPRLVNFIQGVDTENLDNIDELLNYNMEIRLLRETFLLVEGAIKERKLQKIYISKGPAILIICFECGEQRACIYC